MQRRTGLWVSLLVLALASPLWAIIISFDEGYTPGELWGQPGSGTAWQELSDPHRSGLVVTADAGVEGDGDQAVVSVQDSNPFVCNGYFLFPTTDADLGEAFDKDASIVDLVFKRRVLSDVTNNGTVVSRMYLGSDCFVKCSVVLGWFSDGRMKYYNGPGTDIYSNATYVVDAQGNDFDPSASDGYITVRVRANFGTKTYTLTVNDVVQNGGNPIAFNDPAADNVSLLVTNEDGQMGLYRQYALDDIIIQPPSFTVQATVAPDNYVGPKGLIGIQVDLVQGERVVRSDRKLLRDNGTFVLKDVARGTYKMIVRSDCFLPAVINSMTVAADLTLADPIELKGADANGDGTISFEDFAILQNNYGESQTVGTSPLAAATGGCGALGIALISIVALACCRLEARNQS